MINLSDLKTFEIAYDEEDDTLAVSFTEISDEYAMPVHEMQRIFREIGFTLTRSADNETRTDPL
jgi:hypothetical protein